MKSHGPFAGARSNGHDQHLSARQAGPRPSCARSSDFLDEDDYQESGSYRGQTAGNPWRHRDILEEYENIDRNLFTRDEVIQAIEHDRKNRNSMDGRSWRRHLHITRRRYSGIAKASVKDIWINGAPIAMYFGIFLFAAASVFSIVRNLL